MDVEEASGTLPCHVQDDIRHKRGREQAGKKPHQKNRRGMGEKGEKDKETKMEYGINLFHRLCAHATSKMKRQVVKGEKSPH